MTGIAGLEIGLDLILIPVWAYALYLTVELSNFQKSKGRYTAAMPYFVGATGLFLLISLIDPITQLGFPGAAANILFSMEAIQALAGLILFKGIHEIYKHNYASTGFQEVE
ncbi:MAG: hypothetical protein ABEJ87_06150 [Candidatus Nanohalobium sp.]